MPLQEYSQKVPDYTAPEVLEKTEVLDPSDRPLHPLGRTGISGRGALYKVHRHSFSSNLLALISIACWCAVGRKSLCRLGGDTR